MKIDRHARQRAKAYYRACVRPNGGFDERGLHHIVKLLIARKPHHYLAILAQIRRLVEHAIEARTVRIESAAPLADRGKSIVADLEARFGPASRVFYQQNRAHLGGIRVRRGSEIWDGTLRTQLKRLQQSLS